MITLWRDGDWAGQHVGYLAEIMKNVTEAFEDRGEATPYPYVPEIGPLSQQDVNLYFKSCLSILRGICERPYPPVRVGFSDQPTWVKGENSTEPVTEEWLGIDGLVNAKDPISTANSWLIILEALSKLRWFAILGTYASDGHSGRKVSPQDDLDGEWLGYTTYDAAKAKMDELTDALEDYAAAANQTDLEDGTPPPPTNIIPSTIIGGYRENSWQLSLALYNDGGYKYKVTRTGREFTTTMRAALFPKIELSWSTESTSITGRHVIWEHVDGYQEGPDLIGSNVGDIEDGAEFDIMDPDVESIDASLTAPTDLIRALTEDDFSTSKGISRNTVTTDFNTFELKYRKSNFFQMSGWAWHEREALYETGS